MRVRVGLLAACAVALTCPAIAQADYPHVVMPGETLTSVAAADGLSVNALAAANGISPESELIIGQVLEIPPLTPQTAAGSSAHVQPTHSATQYVSDTGTATTQTQSDTDTQTSTTTQPASPPVKHTAATSYGAPEPTDEYVSAAEIAEIADSEGVPPALAEGIAWQESGWSNDVVSNVGAVGVMQIVPTTWSWIDTYLTPADPLQTASAAANIRGGVLLLHQLLAETNGSWSLTAAGYYQGLASVDKHGMYADTQQYVNDVLALAARFGG
ncbi:MAG TPA: transglycosylase SLT domain-containing protein [Solirubrobacteraceae bacterium]|nr:transglycosylase SLT domain-containing protein [Solirubrobacteraceae bacterium]